ncbi:short-chain dehydrogenase/reductase [Pseudoroseomonas deserti]|uniref:Short-chain dehydrogenase/reductase n=1 Tax=Teichococcus deserti TaxID=1817963 RepID=A0A1V2H1P3_9PROT|nr:SDR family oxidoreductase [Pseudoroseomonas deserti]ONG53236.1 short-chain dehydrogenase/reductase [Pseudoroseomonas deserti]
MQHWFITGASAGFGYELTAQLLARGDRVTATLRRPGALDALAERHPGRLAVVTLDVTDAEAVPRVVSAVFAAGRVDVVVSNAAYGLFGPAELLPEEKIRRQMETNLLGSIALIRAALPGLRAQGGGRLLQLSSEGGQIAYPGFSLYHATKWGIEGFVEAVAQEVASFGIEMMLVEPGPTRTGFGAALDLVDSTGPYADTVVGQLARALAEQQFPIRGDVARSVAAILSTMTDKKLPKRLVLGSQAHASIGAALHARLAELEAQAAIAAGADSRDA